MERRAKTADAKDDSASILPIVDMRHICKQFAGVSVLDDVFFDVFPGEVHALAGGNGAGKSTLMKILRGVYSRDAGTVQVDGQEYDSLTIEAARTAGVGMVFQEFSLVPTMTVAENIFMGAETLDHSVFLDKRAMIARSQELLERLGVDVEPTTEVGTLSTGYWQLTEIAKAIRANTKVLILDEPTAALSTAEIRKLFDIIENLKTQGIAVIYISHRMDEIRQIADRITILRNGKNYKTRLLASITDEEIIRGIAGNRASVLAKRESISGKSGLLLDMCDVSTDHISNVTLHINEGEVVGLAGLMGSGRTEVTRALFGIDKITKGTVKLKEMKYSPSDPQASINSGVALVPEDRRKQGLIVSHSVQENLTLNRLRESRSYGLLSNKKIKAMAESLMDRFAIKADRATGPVSRLSGGNQQKVVIAKWLGREPDLLIMDEPTAGVDIGTKTEVLKEVVGYADQGKGVLFISSEFPEMISVCDRYYIMKAGTVVGSVDANEIDTEEDLMLAITHAGLKTGTGIGSEDEL
ncbi:sugar ABC transporter ATP-binding protein [Changpingibacter yushuensis]|uniref:sugar ABC transporter ATP-binding protein n=1 Tax=Changpingibacter yushuensis TaxID=2758440 RepID=UPI001C716436|nr:sugar ABC transporter ATP-binding protein [Changpingibacter yushuensis]